MILKLPYPSIGQCLIEYPTPHQSKTDINFWSFLWILVEGVGCLHQPPLGGWRVPGLPIRNCAGSSSNLVPKGYQGERNRRDVKKFFQRLYWFQD